jgi:predicted 3-demethylubiquinone-9 3-methyltransferase (glyoxalase superfamily)
MTLQTPRIAPCLWFDTQAEEAARYYTGIFKNSRILTITRYGKAGHEIHGRAPGSVMTVQFVLDGQKFTALNGGPDFKFNEAVSFEVHCDTQDEIDYYWGKLGAGGDPKAQQCGWLKDKFGLSWQVVPKMMEELFKGEPSPGSERAMDAMLKMKKLDIAELRRAYEGDTAKAKVTV